MLMPGESRRVTLTADPRTLAIFDVAEHEWRVPGSCFLVEIGSSIPDSDVPFAVRGIKGQVLAP